MLFPKSNRVVDKPPGPEHAGGVESVGTILVVELIYRRG